MASAALVRALAPARASARPAVVACQSLTVLPGRSCMTGIMLPSITAPCRAASSALKSARVALQKRLGQHLLKNPDVVKNIVAAAKIMPHESVFEIGPGTGNMTIHLLQQAKVVYAVELDSRMASAVKARVEGLGLSHKFRCVNQDFLKVPLPAFDALVANIPYQISSPVLGRLFNHRPLPRVAIIMFQKEFAERMVAKPGTSDYCRLSVNSQLLSRSVKLVLKIDRNQFRPPPKVDSAVIEIVPREPPPGLDFPSWDNFLRLVFAGKNKTLRAVFLNKNTIARLLRFRRSPIMPPVQQIAVAEPEAEQRGGEAEAHEMGATEEDSVATVEDSLVATVQDPVVSSKMRLLSVESGSTARASPFPSNTPEYLLPLAAATSTATPTPTTTLSATIKTSEGLIDRTVMVDAKNDLEAALLRDNTGDKRGNSMTIPELLSTYRELSAGGWSFIRQASPTAATVVDGSAFDGASAPEDRTPEPEVEDGELPSQSTATATVIT